MDRIFSIVESVEPVSTIHQESTKGRIEVNERSITCSSFFTIIIRQRVCAWIGDAIIDSYRRLSLHPCLGFSKGLSLSLEDVFRTKVRPLV